MAGWRGAGRSWARRLGVLAAVAALLGGVAQAPGQAAAAGHPGAPPLPKVKAAAGVGRLGVRKTAAARAMPAYRPRETGWPAAAQAGITLRAAAAPLTPAGQAAQRALGSQGLVARGAGTPVWAQPLPGHAAMSGLRVQVLSHAAALAADVHGVVFTARPAAGSAGGPVRLGISYAGFAQASGGNYGLGIGLAELPACALTTPGRPACRVERPLASRNDPAGQDVSAQVSLPASGAASSSSGAAAGVVLAATTTSDGGGPAGTYSATSLRASGTWSEGSSSGAFTYAYPLTVPPAASGLVPSLALNYDSGRVDGQTAATQAQGSWAGDGWSAPDSFIEQSFTPCADNPEGSAAPQSTQDACYGGPVLTWSQDGSSNPLVCPVPFSYTTTSTCKASDDSGEVITHHVNSGNGSGTKFTDYWTLTERDGTTYYFGRNQLPGWASGDPVTGSVDYEPVYSAHSGDPCYSSAGFSSSACTMAYRWNLDYVTDLHGNAMAYYYGRDWNAYAQDGNTSSAVSYTRDSHLSRIDYGFTDGNAYTGHVPDQVTFTTGDRCFAANCDPISTYASNWPDVPYTQDYCAAGASCQVTGPTFWSTVRLASITTQQWNGTAYAPADSWSLAQSLPQPADQTSPTLWLDSITHTGADTTAGGSALKLPAVSFSPVDQGNRVNPGNYPELDRFRIQQVTTETGAQISVSYELTNPCSPSSYPSPSSDTSSCFPVYWQQFTPATGPDWFNKYAVASVAVTDPTGGSPGVYTSYAYNSPAWHYDDNEVVQPKYRTYGQWRGYQTVYTYSGTGTDPQTKTKTGYYQGMNGDTLPSGTRSVTLTDSQGGQHTDSNQLAGNVLESTSYDYKAGPVDHSSIYSYWVSAAAATRTRSGLPDLTANATGQVETWSRQAITDTGTTTWRDTETDTSYDPSPSDALFGLPLHTFSHGDLSGTSQQTCTSLTYAPPNTSENLIGLVAETETDAQPCGGASPGGASAPGSGQVNALTAPASLSRPADVISDTRTFYDNPTLATTWPQPVSPAWPQTAPTLGDASVVQQASGYSGSAFTYQTKSATVYDSYGRPVNSYDANGNLTATSYTMANGVTTGDKVTNPLSQATSTIFDPLRGIPVSVTDPNSITTTVHYDGLGRLTDVWGHNRATTSAASEIYSYAVSNSAPTVVTSQQLNDESGYITSTTLYDGLLRARQTQTPAPNGGMLVTDHFYDSRGWEWKTNTRWLDSAANPGSAIVTVPDSQVPDQQVTDFDGLGRPVLVTSYDDSTVKSTTATAYYGDKVTTVPPTGGTPTSTASDALGRTTELDSYTSAPAVTASVSGGITSVSITGGTTQATGYSYNHRGELSDIKDAATGEDWGKTYNLPGQVTGTTSPNAGATSMTYDPDGNLASSTDARGKTISYTYDALNRKTGEYDGPSPASPQVASWVYDNSNNVSGVTDPVGQLTTETSYSGGNAYKLQQTGFNVFGESLGQTLTLPAAEGNLAGSYTLTHLYSSTTGLLLRDTYPASPGGGTLPAETVTHGYETGFDLPDGLGSTLAAYGQQVSYTPFSQVAREEIGTTTSNAYITDTYDPHTGALTDSNVKNTAVSATAFDDTSYAYDPSGNIKSQIDTRNGTASETQCFAYDTLDRLTQAWTATDNCAADPSGNGGSTVGDGITGGAYWTSWAFNPLGDRATQTQHSTTGGTSTVTSYTYGHASQPDTLTSTSATGPGAGTASYTYDAAGDTLTRSLPSGNQSLTWTDDGKVATDTTSAGATSYVYDAGGNVLLQKDPGHTTLFPFGGAEQLVLNTGTGAVTGTRFLALPGGGQVVRSGAGTAYSFEIGDQHGTSLLTLDNTAANPIWRQYTPYGAARGTAPSSWPDINAFLGKPADTATSLDLLGARQYDPATGRFLSVDPVLDPARTQTLNGYSYAAGNPVTQADPTGLCIYSWCPPPPAHGTAPPSKYGPGSGGGGDGYNPAPSPGTGCQNSPTGCFPGSAGPVGEQPSGPGAPPPPDLHPVAARYTPAGSAVGTVDTPGCNGILSKLGACPSERGAAGTTPQEVKQSAIGAAGILLSAIPIFDIVDAIGAAEDAGAAASDLPGYSSFRAAKADLGSAGPGNVFDHVVEQSQIARSGFAPEEVHNPFNLDPVPSGVNQLKANYYSSIRPFTGGMTVRGWLTGQSFADQYEFGMDTLMHLTNGSPLP
jgi:RHS repeat-associated protein